MLSLSSEAMHAPTCTSGPSLPTTSPPATLSTHPTTFPTSVLNERTGRSRPLRYDLTSGIPLPAAAGAKVVTT